MTDTFTNPFKSFFFANDPNISSEMRKRIALQMMLSKSRAYPKTFGEGLGAIGDALGDLGAARQLGAIDAAENVAGDALLKKYSSPQTEAETDQRTSYAAPVAPAAQPVAPSIVPAARAPAAAPAGGAAPVSAGPGGVVEPTDFNEIDAADPRNRYQPAPTYLQGALDRNIEDPERRGYLGQLAGREARSANEVSPTGAAGPFQFTRGTGAQYGIPGNARFDPDASTLAANRFTDDNVQALTARLGREPTPGEMALAHQQGAGTAANMLTGTGNASARNLAVNNVPPGASPAAAAQRVMSYYGMPGPAGGDPRAGVAAALMAQQAPVMAQDDQQLALTASQPPPTDFGIRPAPPAAPIRQAQQVAQAEPQPGHVLTLGPIPTPPPTMTPLQQRMLQDLNAEPPFTREAARKKLQPIWDQEQAKLAQAQAAYAEKVKQWHERAKTQQEQIEKSAKAKQDYAVQQQTLERGKSPDRVVHEGQILERQKDGSWKDVSPGGTGDRPVKLSDSQAKDLGFYERGKRALADLGEGEKLGGWYEWYASGMPVIGNTLVSKEFQQQLNAAREFAAIVLRRESGAAVTDKELNQVIDRYLPKPGTDPETAIQKAYMREGQVQSFRDALGDKAVAADRFDRRFEVERQMLAEEKKRLTENKSKYKEGDEAVWPDQTIRVFKGGRWVPK